MQPTPGPLHVEKKRDGHYVILTEEERGYHGSALATVNALHAEAPANAALFAAAPDLLDVVQRFFEVLNGGASKLDAIALYKIHVAAGAALAKAKVTP